jgi:hypothetical protein
LFIVPNPALRAMLWAITALSAAGLGACSGSGMGLDANGNPIVPGQSGTVPLSADFNSIQANVFTPICSVCHIGASAPEGLILDAQHSYSLLVNVPSTEVPSILRVNPGNPNNSYIIQKLEGHAAVGGQMPLDETPLPAATIAFIAQWITDGAQAGASAQAAAAFAVASLAPDDGDAVPEAPTKIVVGFTRELDATSAVGQSVRLERESGPPQTPVVTPVITRVSIPAGNPRTLMLTPLMPLAPGNYRVVLTSGPGGPELAALDGSRLTAPPPSNAQGDRIIDRFSVAPP